MQWKEKALTFEAALEISIKNHCSRRQNDPRDNKATQKTIGFNESQVSSRPQIWNRLSANKMSKNYFQSIRTMDN